MGLWIFAHKTALFNTKRGLFYEGISLFYKSTSDPWVSTVGWAHFRYFTDFPRKKGVWRWPVTWLFLRRIRVFVCFVSYGSVPSVTSSTPVPPPEGHPLWPHIRLSSYLLSSWESVHPATSCCIRLFHRPEGPLSLIEDSEQPMWKTFLSFIDYFSWSKVN